MINIKDLTITNDGALHRLSVSFDEYDADGKVTRANVRMSRVITDPNIGAHVDAVRDYVMNVIKQEG